MKRPSSIQRFLNLQFKQPWQLIQPGGFSDATTNIRDDEVLLKQVGCGQLGPSICISQYPLCLVATRREAQMSNFPQARKELAAAGWPVVVRCSGGSCVPQGPGILNLSIIHPKHNGWSLNDGYLLLAELLTRLLNSYDVAVEIGEVPGAFCDGHYNLQSGGKKLVGTAQRWAGGNRSQAAVLAHACLLVDFDLHESTRRINELYRRCNNPQRFDPEACTCLRQCLPGPQPQSKKAFVFSVEERLTSIINQAFHLPKIQVGSTEPD